MIYSILESTMRSAIDKDENKKEDGSINWKFVDADAYMDCKNYSVAMQTFMKHLTTSATRSKWRCVVVMCLVINLRWRYNNVLHL